MIHVIAIDSSILRSSGAFYPYVPSMHFSEEVLMLECYGNCSVTLFFIMEDTIVGNKITIPLLTQD